MNPQARTAEMLVERIGDEIVVYDKERFEAHRLNASAGLVWQHADGSRTEAELAGLLRERLGLPADERLVRLALAELDRAHLMLPGAPVGHAISRRDAMRHLRKAAYLVPVVVSVAVPTPAAAQSGSPTGPSGSVPTVAPPATPTPAPTAAPTATPPPANTTPPGPTPTPTPTSGINPGTYTLTGTATRRSQTGTCNFLPSFAAQVALQVTAAGTCTAQIVEQATRTYSGTMNRTTGEFNCTGNNSFLGCTETNGTCNGTYTGSTLRCTETIPLSGCCSGTVVYDFIDFTPLR
jgi:hypothetical protein